MASSSTSSSARSPEFQKQINDVQSRLTDFIEATRPAHEANLRRAAALHGPCEPEEKTDQPKTPRARRNATNPASADAPSPDSGSSVERHSRKCNICNHPERDLIEAEFLEWSHPEQIARDFKISYSSIYRHARVLGLIERRRQNLCPAVEKVIESVGYVDQPSAYVILRAVRTLACLTGARQWTEPSTTHVVVNATQPPAQSPHPLTTCDPPAESVLSSSATAPAACDSPAVALPSPSHSPVLSLSTEASKVVGPLTTSHSSSVDEPHTAQGVTRKQNSFESNGSSSDSRCGAREPSSLDPPASCIQHLNRHTYEKLEPDSTHTKQTPETLSNRHET